MFSEQKHEFNFVLSKVIVTVKCHTHIRQLIVNFNYEQVNVKPKQI